MFSKTYLTVIAVIICFSSCLKKDANSPLMAQSEAIKNAQRYYTDSVVNTLSRGNLVGNPRLTVRRDLLWEHASVLASACGNVVVVPVKYTKP
ncbi:MAG TPA: hypothetical protein VKQ52_05300, partial [Puia sp.]|nr:hypothetical protein [Puia sp.]